MISINRFSQCECFTIHDSFQVPPNEEHCFSFLAILSCCRGWLPYQIKATTFAFRILQHLQTICVDTLHFLDNPREKAIKLEGLASNFLLIIFSSNFIAKHYFIRSDKWRSALSQGWKTHGPPSISKIEYILSTFFHQCIVIKWIIIKWQQTETIICVELLTCWWLVQTYNSNAPRLRDLLWRDTRLSATVTQSIRLPKKTHNVRF